MIVENPRRIDLAGDGLEESSETIRSRVIAARARSQGRFAGSEIRLNSQIPADLLRSSFKAEPKAMSYLHALVDDEKITARGFHKILRVAWSIADLEGHEKPSLDHVERAALLRNGLRG